MSPRRVHDSEVGSPTRPETLVTIYPGRCPGVVLNSLWFTAEYEKYISKETFNIPDIMWTVHRDKFEY